MFIGMLQGARSKEVRAGVSWALAQVTGCKLWHFDRERICGISEGGKWCKGVKELGDDAMDGAASLRQPL